MRKLHDMKASQTILAIVNNSYKCHETPTIQTCLVITDYAVTQLTNIVWREAQIQGFHVQESNQVSSHFSVVYNWKTGMNSLTVTIYS